MKARCWVSLLAGLALVATACGTSGGATTTTVPPDTQPEQTTTAAVATTLAQTTTTTAASSMDAVRAATVQIVAQGTFVDPFEGIQANIPGSGSGFVIDESGLAVTNNHVVTGAAVLEVFLDGEDRPRNARVVGVSECSDLALIQIDGGGLTALDWYEGPITAGLEILAAGFPLGDPEYTLLDGIVSKEDAFGDVSWASIDAVIEHSADTLPGNSGGPIVTTDGQVVAVNYAGNNLDQSFAISRDVARPIVETLATGEDVDTIGINGEAFFDGVFGGIWVYSVQSGSPADVAGVEPGDLIITLEGLDLGFDETMATYCDVLRSHSPSDVLDIEVYRSSVDSVFSGQLNGTPLEESFSFTAAADEGVELGTLDPGTPYGDFTEITDDSGTIVVTVPLEWSDVRGLPWDFDGTRVGPALSAAPDLELWATTWGTPGVFISASDQLGLTIEEMLDRDDFSSSCTFNGRFDYDDGFYTGLFDQWVDCGPEASEFIVISAAPPDGSYQVLVQILVVTEADREAVEQIINTFFLLEAPVAP